MNNSLELLTGRYTKHLKEYNDFLLTSSTIEAFLNLKALAKKEIGADLQIISAFRNFEKQKNIWQLKTEGKRKVFDDYDQIVDLSKYTPIEKCFKILRFSALPGLSRHHWGTDIDIFDANKLSKKNVQLLPSEWNEGSAFFELGNWLTEKIKNKQAYGFFRPYSQDLGGIHPEPWHLSFEPESSLYFEQYTSEIFNQHLKCSDFNFIDIIEKNKNDIFNKFFLSISS